MNVRVLAVTCLLSLVLVPDMTEAGVAIAIRRVPGSTGPGDDTYMLLEGSQRNGWDVASDLRKEFAQKYGKETPHVCSSGRETLVFYVVIRSTRKDYKGQDFTVYALGTSTKNSAEAEAEAVAELKRRDWGWVKGKHTYSVERRGQA